MIGYGTSGYSGSDSCEVGASVFMLPTLGMYQTRGNRKSHHENTKHRSPMEMNRATERVSSITRTDDAHSRWKRIEMRTRVDRAQRTGLSATTPTFCVFAPVVCHDRRHRNRSVPLPSALAAVFATVLAAKSFSWPAVDQLNDPRAAGRQPARFRGSVRRTPPSR